MTRRSLIAVSSLGIAALAGCYGENTSHKPEPAGQGVGEEEASEVTEFDPQSLKARLDQGEDIYLLDVRTPQELANDGVIAGYNHIEIDQLSARLNEVPKGKPIAIY